MAIVEDEVRDSEEDNEVDLYDDDGEQDSGGESDLEDDEALELKVTEIEKRLAENPYNSADHLELMQTLWQLSELDRWRSAFEQFQQISVLKAEYWLIRLQTETSLAHTEDSQKLIGELFEQAAIDGYSVIIYQKWCNWAASIHDPVVSRAQLDQVLRRAGADPYNAKLFWDAKVILERSQLEKLMEGDPAYKEQMERYLFCLEEIVSRPILHGNDVWPQFEELALKLHDKEYVEKVGKQHEAAKEYLMKILHFEQQLQTIDQQYTDEKLATYQDYIATVKELSKIEKYVECDSNGILKILYDRVTTDCLSSAATHDLLREYALHTQACSSRSTCAKVLDACVRRCPRRATFWVMKMQRAEHDGKEFNEIKSILEVALSKGVDTYKDTEELWMGYLEYMRRATSFDDEQQVERLRRTFRLAWDTLGELWGAEADDCEIPLFWARLEYTRLGNPKQGKEIFEEIFKYGKNKTLSKYWEALLHLENARTPPLSENKHRELFRRALKFVADYPPTVARMWTDFERDVAGLQDLVDCRNTCEAKLKEWRDAYQATKDKFSNQKNKGKQTQNTKDKDANKKKTKKEDKSTNKGKRKIEDDGDASESKKKRDSGVVVDKEREEETSGNGLKRHHEEGGSEASPSKRPRTDSASSDSQLTDRDACTLFVSNLEFKVNESNLRDILSKYGEIMSMRVRSGVKAFGGSICYCQYKKPESVTEALKYDRTPLDGRPMFFSRYSAQKSKPQFKYATTIEKHKLFVKNLPYSECTKEALTGIFDKYGKLKDVRIVTFKDGKPKGLAYIEYEDEKSAAEALSKTNGLLIGNMNIVVAFSAPPAKVDNLASTLGQAKRESSGGMRRTQLSSFIPSVLQRASTSKAPTPSVNGNADKKPMSNTDFRSLLLKK